MAAAFWDQTHARGEEEVGLGGGGDKKRNQFFSLSLLHYEFLLPLIKLGTKGETETCRPNEKIPPHQGRDAMAVVFQQGEVFLLSWTEEGKIQLPLTWFYLRTS